METPTRRPSEGGNDRTSWRRGFMPNPRLVPDNAIGVQAAGTV